MTTTEDPGFEPGAVRALEVRLGGSGAVDDLHWGRSRASLRIQGRTRELGRAPGEVRDVGPR